ncbi:MAG: hypothetical protein ACOCQ1_02605 [Halanaerobiaceae bacterium]
MNILKRKVNITFIIYFFYTLGLTGIAGKYFEYPGPSFWKYIWPFVIFFVGFIFLQLYLNSRLNASTPLLGLFLGFILILYSLVFYSTLIFALRWSFLLFFLVVILGITAGLKGPGTEKRQRSKKFGHFLNKLVDKKNINNNEKAKKRTEIKDSKQKEYNPLDKDNYDVYHAVDKYYSTSQGTNDPPRIKILKIPLGLLGIFSVFYLTLTFSSGIYTGYIYPLILIFSGFYINKQYKNWQRKKKLTTKN